MILARLRDSVYFSHDGLSDREIWNRVRDGQKYAFNHVFKKYAKMLYRYGYKFTSNHKQIEDCIQEVFLTLWEKRGTLGETDCIKPYLLITFRRKLIKELSGNHIIIKKNFEIANYSFRLAASQEDEIIKRETEKELVSKVTGHLLKLPKKQREVLYLRYYCELDYDQVAAVMDISYQSARNLMYKALKALKKQLPSSTFPLFTTLFNFF